MEASSTFRKDSATKKKNAWKKHEWERQWWWRESAWEERGEMKSLGNEDIDPKALSEEQVGELLNNLLVEHDLGGKIRVWLNARPKLVLAHVVHGKLSELVPVKDNTVIKYTNDIIAWLWDKDSEALVDAFREKHSLSSDAMRELKSADRWMQLGIFGGSWYPGSLDKSAALLQDITMLKAWSEQPNWRKRPTREASKSPERRGSARRTPTPLRGRPSDSECSECSSSPESTGHRSSHSPNSLRFEISNRAGLVSGGLVGVLKTTGFVYGFIGCEDMQDTRAGDVFIFFKTNPDLFGKPVDTLVEFSTYEHYWRGLVAHDAVEFDLESFIYSCSLKISLASSLRNMKPEQQAKLLNRVAQACKTWGSSSSMPQLVVQQMREMKKEKKRSSKPLMPPPPPPPPPTSAAARPGALQAETSERSRTRSHQRRRPRSSQLEPLEPCARGGSQKPSMPRSVSRSSSPALSLQSAQSAGNAGSVRSARSDGSGGVYCLSPSQAPIRTKSPRNSPSPRSDGSGSVYRLSPSQEPLSMGEPGAATKNTGGKTRQERAEAFAKTLLSQQSREVKASVVQRRNRSAQEFPHRRTFVSMPLPSRRKVGASEHLLDGGRVRSVDCPDGPKAQATFSEHRHALKEDEVSPEASNKRCASGDINPRGKPRLSNNAHIGRASSSGCGKRAASPVASDDSPCYEDENPSCDDSCAVSVSAEASAERNVVEVRGLSGTNCMKGLTPGATLAELVNGVLADLPSYRVEMGPPVIRSWVSKSGDLRLELQSTTLSKSAVRVLDGLSVDGRQITVTFV